MHDILVCMCSAVYICMCGKVWLQVCMDGNVESIFEGLIGVLNYPCTQIINSSPNNLHAS